MDGLSLTISAAALTTIGGIIGAVIQALRNRRVIEPQPLEVRQVTDVMDGRLKRVEDQVEAIWGIVRKSEVDIAGLKEMRQQVNSMDSKLDRIVSKLRIN